jgi:hypothetical protein
MWNDCSVNQMPPGSMKHSETDTKGCLQREVDLQECETPLSETLGFCRTTHLHVYRGSRALRTAPVGLHTYMSTEDHELLRQLL